MGERELEVHSVRRLRHVPDVVFERHARVPVWSVTYKQNCVARESVRNAVRSLVTRKRVELTIELIAQLCEAAARGTARTESDARGIASRLEDGFTREAPPLIENQTVARARETVQTAGGRPDAGVAIGAYRHGTHGILRVAHHVRPRRPEAALAIAPGARENLAVYTTREVTDAQPCAHLRIEQVEGILADGLIEYAVVLRAVPQRLGVDRQRSVKEPACT